MCGQHLHYVQVRGRQRSDMDRRIHGRSFKTEERAVWRNRPPAFVVGGTAMSRDATEIVTGGPAKTCTFPRTVLAVCSYAFADRKEL